MSVNVLHFVMVELRVEGRIVLELCLFVKELVEFQAMK